MTGVHPSWLPVLDRPRLSELRERVRADRSNGDVYPPPEAVFAALACPLPSVRVVVLGQDPYHGRGQACGLAFSVPPGVPPPPSLRVVLNEVRESVADDLRRWVVKRRPGTEAAEVAVDRARSDAWDGRSGDLSPWVGRGVLLLNTVLTVRAGAPASHAGIGWDKLTTAILREVTSLRHGVVWMLWGAHARRAAQVAWGSRVTLRDGTRRGNHMVLVAPHPSPLAARNGYQFSGCRHFRLANDFFRSIGEPPVDWSISGAEAPVEVRQ